MRVRIGSVSFAHRPVASFADFAAQVRQHVRLAADAGAGLMVFPEYLTGCLLALQPDWTYWTAPYLELFRELAAAHRLYILGGTHLERAPADAAAAAEGLANTAFFFAPDGQVVRQTKLHLTPVEQDPWRLAPGPGLTLLDTGVGRLAILICYDAEFPEAARAAAAAGADILLVPSWTDDRQGFWRVRYCAHARCVENQVYAVHAPLVGSVPAVRYFEQSYGKAGILAPCDLPFARDGIVADGEWNQDLCVLGEVDLALLDQVRAAGSVTPRRDLRQQACCCTGTVRC